MRETKFRAWDKKEKRFFYIAFSPKGFGWASPKYTEQEIIRELDGDIGGVHFKNSIGGWQEYTGLHDKNGVEIYEGDIVKVGNGDICIVEYRPTRFIAKTTKRAGKWNFYHYDYFESAEIIGNIHEHPELLEDKQ